MESKSTKSGSSRSSQPDFDPSLVATVEGLADRQARLLADYLDKVDGDHGGGGKEPIPLEFAMEVAAILQLHMWARADLSRHLRASLPRCEEAGKKFVAGFLASPVTYLKKKNGSAIMGMLIETYLREFAHGAPDAVGADFVIRQHPDEDIMKTITKFLWEHRHLGDSAADSG